MEAEIRKAIENVLHELEISSVSFSVEHPTELSHGDYATNVAMAGAKELGKNPRELAEEISAKLQGAIPNIHSIEIAGPGFINFRLNREFFSEKIKEINARGESWGKNTALEGEKILFEYTSPNLFKPLHIGNLVGNIVGESISRLFAFGGALVYRINFPSDIGLTVAKGVWGLKKTNGDPKDIAQIGEAYRVGNDAYENDPTAKEEIEKVNRALYSGEDESLTALRAQGIQTSRKHLDALCKMLGTTFDTEIFESDASEPGTKIVKEHIGKVFEESDGAVVYKGEKHGLHTRVFLNSQGLPTYEAKDVGNFFLKQQKYPDWTESFVVTGGEQREYFKVLIAALREVFPEAQDKVIEHIPTGFLTLTTGKMSSRKGNVLTGESLLEEVREAAEEKAKETRAENLSELTSKIAVAALKYQILRQAIGTNIIFDKERALSLEGDSGPYLQYTYARIASALTNAMQAEIVPSTEVAPTEPYEVEKYVYQFPEVVLRAQSERAPHYLVTYLTQIASAFNSFYGQEKLVDAVDVYSPYKLAVAQGVKQTLSRGLYLLGIEVPERM